MRYLLPVSGFSLAAHRQKGGNESFESPDIQLLFYLHDVHLIWLDNERSASYMLTITDFAIRHAPLSFEMSVKGGERSHLWMAEDEPTDK